MISLVSWIPLVWTYKMFGVIMPTRCRCSYSSLRLGILFSKPSKMAQVKININDLSFWKLRASWSDHSSVKKLEAHVVLISNAWEGITISHNVRLKSYTVSKISTFVYFFFFPWSLVTGQCTPQFPKFVSISKL